MVAAAVPKIIEAAAVPTLFSEANMIPRSNTPTPSGAPATGSIII